MKPLIAITLFLISFTSFAQKPCEFNIDVTDSIGTYKSTKEYIISEENFAGNTNYIFFSLALTDGLPTLNVQMLQKSKGFLKANCFDKNSKLFLQLNNGKIITLIHIDEENCGSLIRDDKNFDNRVITGNFMFMKDSFEELKKSGMTKLILDLRGNGGGLLIEAVKIVNMFVEKGETIVWMKGRSASDKTTWTATLKPLDLAIPIVVLVDDGSASASEIVSGALQDLDRAVIVGQTSYGKGLVQRPLDLKYNAKVTITIAKYYTPSGRCIQKLDYTNRSAGNKATSISDSLITKFKTKNGREVIDGRGIEPDVVIPKRDFSRLTMTVVVNNIIFDYATKFRVANPEIGSAKDFKFNDQMYADFIAYVLAKDFSYSTASGELMDELKKTAELENYFTDAEVEFKALYEKLKPSKERDLAKFKPELIELLEDEIIGRYYYEKGRIEHAMIGDPFILEAVKILNDSPRYKEILKIQ